MKLGLRSVSMDDISTQLAISKKTLYQHFTDKDELVDTVLQSEIGRMQKETIECMVHAENAIQEVTNTMEMVIKHFTHMNPVIIFDLQKYHFNSFGKFMDHKNKFILDIISKNLIRGIEEGVYRSDINVDVLAKFRLESMMIAFNIDLFPNEKYNLAEVSVAIIENFLYGVATEKGFQLIESYKTNRIKNNTV
ncbi:MAG: hypothetical protein RL131_1400 [Bacteroidota bacterium]